MSSFQVAPPSIVFQTPPVTAPAYIMLGFCGLITRLRVLPPTFPGPSEVQVLAESVAASRWDMAASETEGIRRVCSRATL